MKCSTDGGLMWSERLPTPKSRETSLETPTTHCVTDAKVTKRLILFSGLYPIGSSPGEDDGKTWSELSKSQKVQGQGFFHHEATKDTKEQQKRPMFTGVFFPAVRALFVVVKEFFATCLKPVGDFGGVVAMGFIEPLRIGSDSLVRAGTDSFD